MPPATRMTTKGSIMKPVTGTYALIPGTNYGTFAGDGSPETRLVRIEASTNADGHAALTLTTVGTFPSRDEAINEVVFCPACKMTYLRSNMADHFATVTHAWEEIPAPLRGLYHSLEWPAAGPEDRRVDHFAPITALTDPEVIADRHAEAMGA